MVQSKEVATKSASTLEGLISEGIKIASSQEAVNAVSIATFAKTFFDLSDKQAAALGVGYALLTQHLNDKGQF